jgi:rhamnulokinase
MSAAPEKIPVFAAIDIGASSGRVMAGWVSRQGLQMREVHRFPNTVTTVAGRLRWDVTALFEQVLHGLSELVRRHQSVVSIGIDTWGLDYGLLDSDGHLLAEPVAHRDGRTAAVIDQVHGEIDPEQLYRINGLQFLPITTLYQLAAEQQDALWARARHAVLVPDLLAYWLTGQLRTERTNASTTGLLDVTTGLWSPVLFDALRLPVGLFPPLVEPGQTIGTLLPAIASRVGLATTTPVVAVGSHDTASAVAGTPATSPGFAYVACGTWSLVGVERERPGLSDASRAANFTNESGVGDRIRFLRNAGGLWLLQESLRFWREARLATDLEQLLAAAAALPPGGPTVPVDDPAFLPPGNMPARIQAVSDGARRPPEGPVAITRCILDSLAAAYARTVDDAEYLNGQPVDVVHIVGGGSRNRLLCQLTADLSGRTVHAGPVEASALGNLAVQAQAVGALPADLDELRRGLRSSLDLTSYFPPSVAATPGQLR